MATTQEFILAEWDVEQVIEDLGKLSEEEIISIKGHVRGGQFSTEKLKAMCKHVGISSAKPKGQLIDSIRSRIRNRAALVEVEKSFRKDKNTIPRLLNILFEYPESVISSFNIATRIDLQNDEVCAWLLSNFFNWLHRCTDATMFLLKLLRSSTVVKIPEER